MKLDEQVTILCAQALATNDDAEVRKILAELRLILHQHIEELRGGLLPVLTGSIFGPKSLGDGKPQPDAPKPAKKRPARPPMSSRTWRQVIQEIADEKDHVRALQLTHELNHLLQSEVQSPGQS